MDYVELPLKLLSNLNLVYTFLLLMTRFVGLFMMVPGIGGGVRGLTVRIPAILAISFAATASSPSVQMPQDMMLLTAAMISEFILGMVIGTIPALLVAGAQTAGQLASTTMGLGASQLIDPTTGGQL